MAFADGQAERLRGALAGAVSAGGAAVLCDPGRVGSVIADLPPGDPQLAWALVTAASLGITRSLANLIRSGTSADEASALAAASLRRQTQLAPDVCAHIAGEFAVALGSDPVSQAAGIAGPRSRARRRRTVWISAGALAVMAVVTAAVVIVLSGPPVIHVKNGADALAVTPDGRTLYVADSGDFHKDIFVNGDTVTPVTIDTGTPGAPIKVGDQPQALAVTPDGRTLYVASQTGSTVSVISLKG